MVLPTCVGVLGLLPNVVMLKLVLKVLDFRILLFGEVLMSAC